MDTIKPLFTATATATGGQNGHTEASDGSVSASTERPSSLVRRRNSSSSRTFSIATAAWSAKVSTRAICLSVNGLTSRW